MNKGPRPWHAGAVFLAAVIATVGFAIWPWPLLPLPLATAAASALAFGAVPWAAYRLFGYRRADVGLLPAPAGAWLPAVGLGLAAWFAATPIALWTQRRFPLPPEFEELLVGIIGHPSWLVAFGVAALLPALFEEWAFRGVIFGSLLPLGPMWATAIVSALFALAHGQPFFMVFTFALGILLCLLRLRLGSIWPGVAVHFVLNSTTIALGRLEIASPPDDPNFAARLTVWFEGLGGLESATVLLVGAVAAAWLFARSPRRVREDR